MNLNLKNIGNQADQGRSEFQARGAFMGHGTLQVSGGGRMTAEPADFDVKVRVDDARLPDLNPVFIAYEGVSIAQGQCSVYTEITVKGGRVEGYIKPILRNIKIYDREKDKGKPLGKRVEMHVMSFFASIFRNHSTHDVATVTRISGSTRDPRISGWGAVRKFFSNGFVRGILPGFMKDPKPAEPNDTKKESTHGNP